MKRAGTLVLTVLLLLALCAPMVASANASYIYRRLQYGDSGNDVVQLQKHLKRLGYFQGTLGGNYLDLIQRAVKDFERDHGYKPTSYCTKGMQQTIHDAKTSDAYRTLHYGDSGADVLALQKALKKLGYFSGNAGGNYLVKTRQAVKDFQYDHDLKITNYCTVTIQKRIRKLAG